MIHYRTALLAGVCSLCLCFQFGAVDIGHAASAVEVSGSFDARPAEFVAAQPFANGLTERLEGRAVGVRLAQKDSDAASAGASSNQATPAWAAEATMNPDYNKDEAAAPAASAPATAEAPAAAAAEESAPVSLGGQATTSFFGDTKPTGTPAWAAEATMNPDHDKTEAAAPAATEAAAAAEEPAPVSLGGQATTSFFGDTKLTGTPAWAAEAGMNPGYDKNAPASSSGSATAPEPAAAQSVRSAAVEECQGAVNSAVKEARLLFNEAGYTLSSESRSELRKVAKALKTCGEVVIEIAGHTDNVGTPETNKELSQLRAKEVVEFLVGAGVGASKLKAVGHGQESPVADNASANGRKLNRRVEVQVSGQ